MDNHLDQELTGATRRNELFFWLFSIVALFLFLGHNALWASEDRWAEIAREMLITGDLLHPALNWQVYFDKPHLTYWLILPFAIVRGGFDEFIVRIPSALAGLAGLWGTLMLSKKLFDRRTALLAGWMLLTCYGFLFWARTAAADTANLAAIILAVAYFYQVEEKATFHRYLIFYLICFLGALAKGLPALVMPFVVIAPHLLAEKRWLKHLRVSNFLAFFLAAGLYFLPFYLASILPMEPPLRAQGNELSGLELVWRENIVRVFDAFDHKDPFYSYFYNLPRTLLPWVLVIGVSIAGMVRNWKKLPPPVRELMIGTLAMFVLFCCSTSRRWYYILPVMPFCAVLAAAGLCRGLSVEKWDRPVLLLMRLLVIIGSSLGVASLVGIPLWNHFFKFSPPLLAVIALPAAGLLALGAILIDNQPESPVERWTGLPRRMGSMVLGCAILVVCVFDCVIPSLTRYRTEKQLYDAILAADLGLSPERIFIWRDDAPSKLLFYLDLQRPVTDSPDFIWRRAFTEEQIRAMTPEQRRAEQQKRNLADLRQFLERNAGHQVAIFSFDRESDLKPLARAAAELGLPIDVEKPDFSERRFDVMESKSRRRSVWTPRLPQTFEEKHEEVK